MCSMAYDSNRSLHKGKRMAKTNSHDTNEFWGTVVWSCRQSQLYSFSRSRGACTSFVLPPMPPAKRCKDAAHPLTKPNSERIRPHALRCT